MALAALQMFVREGSLPIYRSFGGTKHLIFPRAEVARYVVNGTKPPPEHLAQEVARWLAQYPPVS